MVSAVSNTNYRVANSEFRLRATANTFLQKDDFIERYPNISSELGWPTPGLWGWGYNTLGSLGLGDVVHRSSPVQVGSLTNWKQVASCGSHVLAIKEDNTLWSWGYNPLGQLGIGKGDTVHRSSPTQVGSLTTWKQASGYISSGAIKIDGTLWTWGQNTLGELGLGDVVHRSSPVQVGSLTNWKYLNSGGSQFCAIKTDGTLWTWGYNPQGNLGLGDVGINRSSPVQVGTLTNWKQVSAANYSVASIKTDGTLWTWGNNTTGQLGLGNIVHRSSPVQVGSLTNWKQALQAAEIDGFMLAIKTDGTLWGSGGNGVGQLGLNDITIRSSPVQVGTLTNWKSLSQYGSGSSIAIKTNGTLWTWGYNIYGQLGTNTTVRTSSPAQVGSLTTWKQVSGTSVKMAIQDGIY